MNFRRFAILNVLRNKRIYMAHFLSSAFSVMIFFTYALLLFHPDLKGELVSSSGTLSRLGTIGMQVSEVIIFVFSFFFLLYSVGAFLKLRKKEFGILILLGMSRRQLNRMLFVENAWIGFAALAFGIGFGLIFSKLILLASARLLAIEDGLRFYVPLNAVLLTVVAFGVLFLMIASLTSVMAGKERVAELILAEDKPKPEPAASPWLSALAVLLLAGGYGIVLDFAINRHFSFQQLLAGVALSIAGTYFLFTQTSVYALRALRGKKLFFRRTNMLTLSELTYRMRDNAATFFIVAVVSAVAFTGIGTTLALGDPGLAAMYNPYAYSYSSYSADYSKEPAAVADIGRALQSAGRPYTVHPMSPLQTDSSYTLVKLSEYNRLAADLGYPAEALAGDGETFLTPSYLWQKEDWEQSGNPAGGEGTANGLAANPTPVELVVGGQKTDAHIVKYVPRIVLPDVGYAGTLVVTDGLYDRLQKGVTDKTSLSRTYLFAVPDWQKTVGLSKELVDRVNNGGSGNDYLRSLALEWVSSKQENGMLFIVSGLVGIVFFTFAASTIYFRLYADMDRDERQYGMIAKVGLSGKELSRIMTRQLFIMFFVPLLMALVHSSVAFFALQLLVDYSVVAHSLAIFASFVAIQLVYFLIARWRAVEHLRRRLAEPGLTR